MILKKFLILTLICLNLVACSKNNKPKEDINSNTEISVEDTTKNLKNDNSTNEESKINNTNNIDINKDNNIKFEICDEIVNYQQDDELYYNLAFTYGKNGNQSIGDFFDSENSLEKLKSFNTKLKSTFDYNELNTQPLEYRGYFKYDKKFSRFGIINEPIEIQGQKENLYRTNLRTLMIGESLYGQLDNYIEEGKNFSSKDFIVNNSEQEISMILGNSYKDIYKIGDEINLYLHQKPLKFRVIGFLKKDSEKLASYTDKNINETVVIPFYDINYAPNDEIDDSYQKIYYTQKDEGYIKLKESETNEVIKSVQNIEDIYYDYLERVEKLAEENGVLFSIPICPIRIEN